MYEEPEITRAQIERTLCFSLSLSSQKQFPRLHRPAYVGHGWRRGMQGSTSQPSGAWVSEAKLPLRRRLSMKNTFFLQRFHLDPS